MHYDFRLPNESAAVSQLELGKSVCGIKALDEGRAGGRSFIASGYMHQVRRDAREECGTGLTSGSLRCLIYGFQKRGQYRGIKTT